MYQQQLPGEQYKTQYEYIEYEHKGLIKLCARKELLQILEVQCLIPVWGGQKQICL